MATQKLNSGNRITRKQGRVNRVFAGFAALLVATQVWSGTAIARQPAAELARPAAAPVGDAADPVVTVFASTGATIKFLTQNDKTVDGRPPEELDLPHLVLRRNGQLTDAGERTLSVAASGLAVDPAGALVILQLATMHNDPDAGDNGQPVVAGQTTAWVTTSSITVSVTMGDADGLATPSDYYSLTLSIARRDGSSTVVETPVAFLLESQWIAPLPKAAEEIPGAAPDSLVIYYTDMVPFQRVAGQPNTRLMRAEVDEFVGATVLPELVEAFRLQSNEWGFVWHNAWTGLRGEEDSERLSVALGDGATWFHGAAPVGANSTIAINVNAGLSGSYATLADGIASVFHHELFHNLQRSMRLHLAGRGDVDGPARAWAFISEGMAVAAQSVARPDLEYGAGSETRAIYSWSNAFVTGAGHSGEALNNSYADLNPYQDALYWRFLFEAAGGLDDPAAGMALLRSVLDTLYSAEVVDMEQSGDLVRYLPEIMDRALAKMPNAPFASYRESLRSFARSLYGAPAGNGLYDPGHQFARPAAERMTFPPAAARFDPQNLPTPRGISGSYGIDYVQIDFEPSVQKTPVQIEVRAAAGSAAEFDVQVLGLDADGNAVPAQLAPDSVLLNGSSNGQVANMTLNATGDDLTGAVLIIVRVDNMEAQDGQGRYDIAIQPVYPTS